METNQSQSANGSRVETPAPEKQVADKQATAKPEPGKSNLGILGVWDQLLNSINDNVLNAESAVRGNTGQLKAMASSVAMIRDTVDKMDNVEDLIETTTKQVTQCSESVNRLWERMDKLGNSMLQVAQKPEALEGAMQRLGTAMQRHTELFEKPQEKTVHHRHYLHWHVWFIVVLSLVGIGLFMLWHDARRDADLNAENALLWRAAKLLPQPSLQQALDTAKSHYNNDPVQFRQGVEAEEAHNEELTERLQEAAQKRQEADEKQHEADELKKQGPKR